MNSNNRFPYWATWKHTIGGRFGDSVAGDGWGCALCTTIASQASWWIPPRACSTATAAAAVVTVIRFVEIHRQVKFPQALALLQQWRGLAPLLHEAGRFYRVQLHRHAEAVAYLRQRGLRSPELIEHMRIGYAPGSCLRAWLTQLGYPLSALRQAGLVSAVGYDTYTHRIVFPLPGNLYGRSIELRGRLTGFCRAPKVACMPGSRSGNTRR